MWTSLNFKPECVLCKTEDGVVIPSQLVRWGLSDIKKIIRPGENLIHIEHLKPASYKEISKNEIEEHIKDNFVEFL